MPSSQHCDDDELERYLMDHIQDEDTLAQVEEHLIVCAECVARAEAMGKHIATMKNALRSVDDSGPADSDA